MPVTAVSEPANGEGESEGNKPQGEIWISSGEDQVAGSGQVQEDTAFDSTTSCFGQPIICRYEGCKKRVSLMDLDCAHQAGGCQGHAIIWPKVQQRSMLSRL